MVYQHSETKIRPSDVYPNLATVQDFVLNKPASDAYYIIGFRPPRYGDEYLDANGKQVLGACVNATQANPRFILARRIYLMDAWE